MNLFISKINYINYILVSTAFGVLLSMFNETTQNNKVSHCFKRRNKKSKIIKQEETNKNILDDIDSMTHETKPINQKVRYSELLPGDTLEDIDIKTDPPEKYNWFYIY